MIDVTSTSISAESENKSPCDSCELTDSKEVNDTIKNNTICAKCANAAICKYAESYSEYVEALKGDPLPNIIHIQVNCKYYRSKISPVKPKDTISLKPKNKGSFAQGIQIKHTRHDRMPVTDSES